MVYPSSIIGMLMLLKARVLMTSARRRKIGLLQSLSCFLKVKFNSTSFLMLCNMIINTYQMEELFHDASPTLDFSIEFSGDIYMCMSVCLRLSMGKQYKNLAC